MSKQSKVFRPPFTIEIYYKPKAKSQKLFPASAEKGKSFSHDFPQHTTSKRSKSPLQNQYQPSYRDKRRSDNFLSFYRMKSLFFPVQHLTSPDLRNFKVIGTMEKKIIIAFNQKLNLFCFFDQHAMHERIRYEYYLEQLKIYDKPELKIKQWNASIIEKSGQQLKVISGIKHSYSSYKVTNQFKCEIQESLILFKYGFEVQYSKEETTLKVLKVPQLLERQLDHKLTIQIAQELIRNQNHLPKSLQSLIAEISCKSAYKFNQYIQTETINELILNLSLCQYPFFCVHGRPILFTRI